MAFSVLTFVSKRVLFKQVPDLRGLAEGARSLSALSWSSTYVVTPDTRLGHPPYGPAYNIDVSLGSDKLPERVDWRMIPGALPALKDQGHCGCCYICAAIGAIHNLNFIKTGESVELSVQHILDCNTVSNHGCFGGRAQEVFDFIVENNGVATESSYPYDGMRLECRDIMTRGVRIDGWMPVMANVQSIKYTVAHQVVVASLRATKQFKTHDPTSNGILYGPSYSTMDHSVLITGYDARIKGEEHWGVMNSHGSEWGDGGFGKIAMTGQDGGPLGLYNDVLIPIKRRGNGLVKTKCESCPVCFPGWSHLD